jgi:hypothetical protein
VADGGSGLLLAVTALGALWGATGYAILWGYTPIVATRSFVDSPAGLAGLLPVRIVLEGIHLVEAHLAGHPFDFSRNHDWIGFLAAAVGAVLLVVPAVVIREIRGRVPRR